MRTDRGECVLQVDIQSLLVAGAVDAQTLEAQNKQSNDEFSKLFTSLQITASQKHGGKSEAAPTTATSEVSRSSSAFTMLNSFYITFLYIVLFSIWNHHKCLNP